VNISDMVVGRDSDGVAALMVMSIDSPAGDAVVESLRGLAGVVSVTRIDL
jgi:hypothetical protein